MSESEMDEVIEADARLEADAEDFGCEVYLVRRGDDVDIVSRDGKVVYATVPGEGMTANTILAAVRAYSAGFESGKVHGYSLCKENLRRALGIAE